MSKNLGIGPQSKRNLAVLCNSPEGNVSENTAYLWVYWQHLAARLSWAGCKIALFGA